MAVSGSNQFPANNGDSLFVSPDRLVLDHGLNTFRCEDTQRQHHHNHQRQHSHHGQAQSHHQTVWASQNQQQRPSLPLHAASDWSIPTQQTLRNLPPTPISPFRPLRPLSEDEKLAFPCTGDVDSCWNRELCPKHRQCPDANTSQQTEQQQHVSQDFSQPPRSQSMSYQAAPPPNPRRRSAPALDLEGPPTKIKRNATDPEEADSESTHSHHIRTPSIVDRSASRPSLTPRGRVPHNLVERRYRDNLNNQIEALRLTLPSLREAVPCTDIALEDTSSPRMPSKAVIISTAATYIKDMETERMRLLAANKALQEQVAGLQRLVKCDDCSILGYLNGMQLNVGMAGLPTPS